MRKCALVTVPRLVLFAVVALLCVGLAAANERIVFKNGHTIVAKFSRVEGEFIFLTLDDGSEVGFPKSLVKSTESGAQIRRYAPAHGWSGRGPSATETEAYRRHMLGMGKRATMVGGVAAHRARGERLNTVGFTVAGGFAEAGRGKDRSPGIDLTDPSLRASGGSSAPLQNSPAATPRGATRHLPPAPPPVMRPPIVPRIRQPGGANAVTR